MPTGQPFKTAASTRQKVDNALKRLMLNESERVMIQVTLLEETYYNDPWDYDQNDVRFVLSDSFKDYDSAKAYALKNMDLLIVKRERIEEIEEHYRKIEIPLEEDGKPMYSGGYTVYCITRHFELSETFYLKGGEARLKN